MAKLNGFVHVTDDSMNPHVFGPDDDVPSWAAEKIGDHAWEGGKRPTKAQLAAADKAKDEEKDEK